jgi:predicted negative regulator of RcsB-dependent stress response
MALCAYWPVLGPPVFHLDDYSLLSDPLVTRFDGFWGIWIERIRPLTYVTFWLNHHLGGYSFTSLLLHLGSIVCARLTLAKLMPVPAAMVATALFAVHPVQTEAVCSVFARGTPLAAFLCLLALWFWLRGKHWIAVGVHFAALLSKEEAVAFPVFLVLLHLSISRNRAEWKPIGVMALLSAVTGVRGWWMAASIAGSGAGVQAGIAPWDYVATQAAIWLRYQRQLILPINLNFDPDLAVRPDAAWLWLLWITVALACCWCFTRAQPGFWILGALVFLLPTTLIPLNDLAADRRLYLTVLCLGAAVAAAPVNKRWFAIPVLLLAYGSFTRAQLFRSEEALWRDTVAKSPAKLRPRMQLARAVNPQEAVTLLAPFAKDHAEVWPELGRAYLAQGDAASALQWFGKALAADPQSADAHNNRGAALLALGQRDAAIADFTRALAIDPRHAAAGENLRKAKGSRPNSTP